MRTTDRFVMIVLALVSLACTKEKTDEIPVPGNPNVVVFTANVPTRTSIDANDQVVSWTAGDEVKFVWAGGSTTATAASSGSSTTFTVEVGEGISEVYAVYPATAGGSYNEGSVNVHFNGSRTDGSFAANDICVAKAVKTGDTWGSTLAFKNVACLLKVGVTDSEVTKIQVMGGKDTESAQAISGSLPVNINDSGVITTGTAASTGVTVSVTVSGTGNYYIPVLPGVTLSDGFRIGLFKGEEQGTPFFYNGSFETTRGKIIKLNDIDTHAGQFYVTPAGAGSKAGQNWTNAMGISEFKAFVTNQDNHFLLKGSTFHFSADEFSFGDDYLKLHYPDHGNVAFTLEGTVTASDTTTFVGRTATSGTTAGVLWPQSNSYITVKNVKFTGTDGASNASVIRLNNGARELNLDHCYFRFNQTLGNGGSISVFNSATVNISNCSFSNTTGCGGVIHVNHASATVNIQDSEAKAISKNAIYGQSFDTFTCTRVTFRDNDDAGEYGPAAYISGKGTISFNDCDFIRNHSSNRGGAICIREGDNKVTDAICTFTDCEFVDNWSDKRGGAVMIDNCSAITTFTGGKFEGNYANGAHDTEAAGGAIYAIGSFRCTDVLFKQNHNYVGTNENSGGIIRLQKAGETAYFDNCVFDGNYTNRENSKNPPCAAIVNCRIGGVKYYFNACEFKENTSGTGNSAGIYGGTRGTVFATLASSTFAFNNCSFHDNYGGRNTDDITWIGMDNANSTLILANTTIAGDNCRVPNDQGVVVVRNNWGVIKFQNTGNFYLINSILCSNDADSSPGNCFWVNGDIMVDGTTKISEGGPKLPVYCYYCKTSKEGDNRTDWGSDTGSGHNYYASSASFGGWTAPYIWNGTLTGTNSSMMAATDNVNTEIQTADSDFHTWLNSIGALGKDINGNNRGTTSWPGCYQN